jgi:hypothetical protein
MLYGVAFRRILRKQVRYLTAGNGVSERKINIEADMVKLTEFYKQHRRLFLAQKHQNTRQTEKFKNAVMLKFLEYCESQKIFHTAEINKKVIIKVAMLYCVMRKDDKQNYIFTNLINVYF